MLGLQPTQRIALDDRRRGMVARPPGRVAAVVVHAAWFQEGVGLLGQCQVGLEHPFQRGPLRRGRLLQAQALTGIDPQQVVQPIAQLPGLVLSGRLHQLGVDKALQQPSASASPMSSRVAATQAGKCGATSNPSRRNSRRSCSSRPW